MRFVLFWIGWTLLLFSAPIKLPGNFSAQFTQTVTNPDKKVITYTGSVRFSDKKHLKWIYQTPTSKEVCSNGVHLVVVDHDLEQISYYVMDQGFDLAKILKVAKPFKNEKHIYVAHYNDQAYAIGINRAGEVQRIMYEDKLENRIEIIFTKIRYGNEKVASKEMLCHEPEMYDRIEE